MPLSGSDRTMRTFFVIAALLVAFVAPAMAMAPWIASYCGMGHCSWTRITTVEKVQVKDGALLRVQEQTCAKDYPEGREYPKSYACRPNETKIKYEAVYCSVEAPRVAYRNEKNAKWIVRHLSFDEQHNDHAHQWDNRLYFLVCHGMDIEGEGFRRQIEDGSYSLEQTAKRFGYHPISAPDVFVEDTEVDSIEEVAPPATEHSGALHKYNCIGKRLAATHPELCAMPEEAPTNSNQYTCEGMLERNGIDGEVIIHPTHMLRRGCFFDKHLSEVALGICEPLKHCKVTGLMDPCDDAQPTECLQIRKIQSISR